MSRRPLLLLAIVAVLTVGCHPRGYMVWAVNESDRPVLVLITGERTLGEAEDPAAASYRVEPHASVASIPFVYLYPTESGLVDGRVTVVHADCTVLDEFVVFAGDYLLTISDEGVPSLAELGLGQRPTTQDTLATNTACVGG